jgi:hypothetical protein
MLQTDQQLRRSADPTAAGGDAGLRLQVCRPHSNAHCGSLHPSQRYGWLLEVVLQWRWLDCGATTQHATEAVPSAPRCKVGSTSDCKFSLCFCCQYCWTRRKTGAGAQVVVVLQGRCSSGGLGAMGRPPWPFDSSGGSGGGGDNAAALGSTGRTQLLSRSERMGRNALQPGSPLHMLLPRPAGGCSRVGASVTPRRCDAASAEAAAAALRSRTVLPPCCCIRWSAAGDARGEHRSHCS